MTPPTYHIVVLEPEGHLLLWVLSLQYARQHQRVSAARGKCYLNDYGIVKRSSNNMRAFVYLYMGFRLWTAAASSVLLILLPAESAVLRDPKPLNPNHQSIIWHCRQKQLATSIWPPQHLASTVIGNSPSGGTSSACRSGRQRRCSPR